MSRQSDCKACGAMRFQGMPHACQASVTPSGTPLYRVQALRPTGDGKPAALRLAVLCKACAWPLEPGRPVAAHLQVECEDCGASSSRRPVRTAEAVEVLA